VKILACTDGSKHSKTTLEKAALIAGGCQPKDVAVIHVYEGKRDSSAVSLFEMGSVTRDKATELDPERLNRLKEEHEAQREKILADALEIFEKKGVKARTILKQGHPAEMILKIAEEEGFDLIIIGNRGLGGLQKLLLGSVGYAVIQEAKNCSVLMVK
jgi:nucleotide-binding universal stress UspA family protein